MKRVLAVMLAVVIVMMTCAVAEDSSSDAENYEKNLAMMELVYRMTPENIDKDQIMYTYYNFMICMNRDGLKYFYYYYSLAKNDGTSTYEKAKKLSYTSANLVKTATDGYLDWMNGNLTDAEYLDILMPMVEVVLED